MVSPFEGPVIVSERSQRHQEHGHDALHGTGHGITDGVIYTLRSVGVVKGQEYYVIG